MAVASGIGNSAMEESMDDPIPLKEAARRFGVSVARLRKAADESRLEVRRLAGSRDRLVCPSEVRRFLADGGKAPVSWQPQRQPLERDGSSGAIARVIAITIPKGGTGKTTTTVNLGAAFAESGKRVLLVDLDPQGSLSLSLGYQPRPHSTTIYEAIADYVDHLQVNLPQAIVPVRPNIDLVPATVLLNLANSKLITARNREYVVRKLLESVRMQYDIILIDTLPYLGVLVDNALYAADEVLIPSQAQYLSTQSIMLIVSTIDDIRKSGGNPHLRVCGILLTQVQDKRVVDRHFRSEIRAVFEEAVPVFQTEIKANTVIQKSQSMSPPQTCLEYAPDSDVANAYRTLAQEVFHATQVLA